MELTFPYLASVLVLAYLCLVRSLRWRRYNAVHKKYSKQFETRTLTPEEAQQVLHILSLYDMPSLLQYAGAFSMFKPAGIVRIILTFPCTFI
jgi:hypothetical protein